MTEMARRFLRQKFDNPVIAVALAALALLVALPAALAGGPGFQQTPFLALIVIAAASVSKDAATGALQMILVRPISRTDYLYGRYLGILAAYGIFLAVCALLTVLFSVALMPALKIRAEPLSWEALALGAAGAFLSAVLFSAVLLFFSTFLPGYGDLVGYFLLSVALGVLASLGGVLRKPWLTRVFETVKENVLPEPDWGAILMGDRSPGAATGRWALAVVAFLIAAAVVFRRREFAYGQD